MSEFELFAGVDWFWFTFGYIGGWIGNILANKITGKKDE